MGKHWNEGVCSWIGLAVLGKHETEMSEAFIFAENLFLTLMRKIWHFGSEVLKNPWLFFSPFLPFLKIKESCCCVVRVVGHEIPGTGGDPSSQASPGFGRGLQLVSPCPTQLPCASSYPELCEIG